MAIEQIWDKSSPVLIIGATGYVGSRLVPMLVAAGFKVRAASRSLEKLQSRDWADSQSVELAVLDMNDISSVKAAVKGCKHVYYLVHSMNRETKNFAENDRLAAQHMVEAGDDENISQLIYLGGLGEANHELSEHLKSRAEVATVLKSGKFPLTVLRAAMIIGSGSASFEILRYLVDRLPVMITPKWVSTPSQPIAIRNVLNYLVGCLDRQDMLNESFDIGGTDVLTYRKLMEIYALESGLHEPIIIPVPVFTPWLSSYWINYITPVPAYIARPLAQGLRNPTFCLEARIKELIPQDLLSCREAISIAIDRTQHHRVESHWTDAGKMQPVEWFNSADPEWAGGAIYQDIRRTEIIGSAADAWKAVSRIGGTTGWYYANWLWKLRGVMDWLVGGDGLRSSRRSPDDLRLGDAVDFWRVESLEHAKRVLLIAEMRLPGQAGLEFRISEIDKNKTQIEQIARFLPDGLLGLAYWYSVMPLHEFIFTGMLRGIAKASGCKISMEPRKMSELPR